MKVRLDQQRHSGTSQRETQHMFSELKKPVTRIHTHAPRKTLLVHERVENNSYLHQITPPPLKSQIVHPQEHKQSLEITASSSCQNQKTNSKKRKILHYSRMTKRPTIVILLRTAVSPLFIYVFIVKKKNKQVK